MQTIIESPKENGSFLPQIQGCKFSFAIFTHGALAENSVPNHKQNPRKLVLPELGHVANHIAVTREWFLSPDLSSRSRQVSDFGPEKRKKKNSIQRLQLQFSISMQTLLLGLLPSCKLLCYELDQLSEITCGAESARSLVCRATIHTPTPYTHSLLVWYLQFTTQPPCVGLVMPLAWCVGTLLLQLPCIGLLLPRLTCVGLSIQTCCTAAFSTATFPLWNFFRTCFTASSLSATYTANAVYRGLRIKLLVVVMPLC